MTATTALPGAFRLSLIPGPAPMKPDPPSGIEADYTPHGKVPGLRSDGLPDLKLAAASFP
ncbi:MAG: hypothetical protein OXI88_05385 [Gammaproteobacteria bacterium]|nr:hypothetical protein [Gammaproteobacteria bacterium]MDE0284475.1 hypothetical protein [Gammaproteobacteria bacterium]MDE0511199.1 hypothetical protein [Gammaproteobacteria bacterium]